MLVRLYLYDPQEVGGGEPLCRYALQPEPLGRDDGGRDYVLPQGYTVQESRFTGPAGTCRLLVHNGLPLLVDEARKLAFLLEKDRKITRQREAAGLSSQQLADAAGVSLLQLYQWEHNETEPGSAALGRLARALGCDVLALL